MPEVYESTVYCPNDSIFPRVRRFPSMDEKLSPKFVEEVRNNVLDVTAKSGERFDPVDMERIRSQDGMIKRFILEYMESTYKSEPMSMMSQKIANNICETLRWRCDFGVNRQKDSDFPIELYNSGLISFVKASNGHDVLVIRSDRLIRLKYWSDVWIKFIVHEVEKMTEKIFEKEDFFDQELPHVLCDSSKAGLGQMDLHFLLTIIPIFFRHYPMGVSKVWLYEVPFLNMAIKPIVMRVLPTRLAKKVMFTDRRSIVREMGYERTPYAYGGSPGNVMRDARSSSLHNRRLQQIGEENQIPVPEILKMTKELLILSADRL